MSLSNGRRINIFGRVPEVTEINIDMTLADARAEKDEDNCLVLKKLSKRERERVKF